MYFDDLRQNEYRVEWNAVELAPVARILNADGKPTSAFVVLDVRAERPEFITPAQWEEAKELQLTDDQKPF